MEKFSKTIEIGGRQLTLETGGIAGQTDAAVLGRYGDTMVLVTVVSSSPKEGLDYFPLSVEYLERLYAGGRIKGSRWVKREGRPSDEAVLKGRIIDRSIRPLFPKDYKNEVQVVATILSVDLENDPDVLSLITASAALSISSVPWNGPLGAMRVGLKEGVCTINPINEEVKKSDLDLIVASTKEKAVMIEGGAMQVPEATVLEAIKFAKAESAKIIDFIVDFAKEIGKEKQKVVVKEINKELKAKIHKFAKDSINGLISKEIDYKPYAATVVENFKDNDKFEVASLLEKIVEEETRAMLLSGKRPDGRKNDEVRPLSMSVGMLPRTHGSAIFTRGQTQVLAVTTLAGPALEQLIESAEGEESKRFIHHYSMPPYSSGETGRFGSLSRREIGHGALAERAIEPVIPSAEVFPYTIRLVSEVLSSNGSTSMASTCGSILSLMDAGVPILAPVAGIAMGIVSDGDDKFILLTDIAGIEDHSGEMDFKITGTTQGITAIQLDVKNVGLTDEMISQTLSRSREARIFILGKMAECLPVHREKVSQYAPKVKLIHVPVEKIGEVIGPGGKTIRKIIEETGCEVEIKDDGTVNISGLTDEAVANAEKMVDGLTREVKPGEEYDGVVKRIQPFGAFVEILPGKDGLVHVSQMSADFVDDPNKIVTIGQVVKVRVLEIDELHRINLSMLFGEDANKVRTPRPPSNRDDDRPRRSFGPRRPQW